MTQSVLAFNDLPNNSQVSIPTSDRGTMLYGIAQLFSGSLSTLLAETVFVAKNGNDATADGSVGKPFLTIAAAQASITDAASTKPYTILVASGRYTDPFDMKPWIFIEGLGDPNAVVITNVIDNLLNAAFAGGGSQEAGLSNCTVTSANNVKFDAIGSTGAGVFRLSNVFVSNSWGFSGNNNTNAVVLENVQTTVDSGLTFSFTNIAVRGGFVFLRSNAATFTNTAAYSMIANFGAYTSLGSITVTAAVIANFCILQMPGFGQNTATSITLSGDGAYFRSWNGVRRTVAPDADTTFEFFPTTVASSTKLLDGGENLIFCNNTAARTYTFLKPGTGTRFRFKNQGNFVVNFLFPTAGVTNDLSYLPPGGWFDAFFSDGTWMISNVTQSGTTTLTNGVSPFIPADISATVTTAIVAMLKTFGGATGIPAALSADRVTGTRAGGGGFVLKSVLQATGAVVATDQGTYDWLISGGS